MWPSPNLWGSVEGPHAGTALSGWKWRKPSAFLTDNSLVTGGGRIISMSIFYRVFFKGILREDWISRVLEAFPELCSLLAVAPDGNTPVHSHVPGWKGIKSDNDSEHNRSPPPHFLSTILFVWTVCCSNALSSRSQWLNKTKITSYQRACVCVYVCVWGCSPGHYSLRDPGWWTFHHPEATPCGPCGLHCYHSSRGEDKKATGVPTTVPRPICTCPWTRTSHVVLPNSKGPGKHGEHMDSQWAVNSPAT